MSACDQPLRLINSLNGKTTASRKFAGGWPYMAGSRIIKLVTRPGNMKSAVIENTICQLKKSDKIKESDPGTKVEIL